MRILLAIVIAIVATAAVTVGGCRYYVASLFKTAPPPSVITVRGEKWDLLDAEGDTILMDYLHMRHAIAYSQCSSHLIVYDGKDQDLRNSVWHEVFHAGACGFGGASYWNSKGDDDDDHPGIQNLADFIEDFTRNNPSFVKWEKE